MIDQKGTTDAIRQYAEAYATHYTEHNLRSAFRLYEQIIASHPSDPEAEYSRVQIQHIVKEVVPKQELLDVQMKLAMSHFEHSA